jgi:hypothetical protein
LSTTNPTWPDQGSNTGHAVWTRPLTAWAYGMETAHEALTSVALPQVKEPPTVTGYVSPRACLDAVNNIKVCARNRTPVSQLSRQQTIAILTELSWQVARVLLVSGLVHSTVLKMEATRYSATSADFYHTTRSHKPQDRTLSSRRCSERQIQRHVILLG